MARDRHDPLITIIDSVGITLSYIRFLTDEAPAVVAGSSDPADRSIEHGALLLQDCVFVARGGCAVLARAMTGAAMLRCHVLVGPFTREVRLDDFRSPPALFLQGERLVVERCQIMADRGSDKLAGRLALGGLQIGGSSREVTIRDNCIEDGAGIGITLGSIAFVKLRREDFDRDPDGELLRGVDSHAASDSGSVKYGWRDMLEGFRHGMSAAGCVGVDPVDPDPGGGGDSVVPVSEGAVDDVEILHNRILDMGSSGIATYPLGLSPDGKSRDAVAVSHLLVADNLISGCLWLEVHKGDDLVRTFLPLGGIGLAVALQCVFRGNEIVDNGAEFGGGTCGIGIVYGQDILVEGNRIEGNGLFDKARAVDGPNAGVHVMLAIAGRGRSDWSGIAGDLPALTLHDNVIGHPAGRALRATTIGPTVVVDNRLVGGNPSRLLGEYSSRQLISPTRRGCAAPTTVSIWVASTSSSTFSEATP